MLVIRGSLGADDVSWVTFPSYFLFYISREVRRSGKMHGGGILEEKKDGTSPGNTGRVLFLADTGDSNHTTNRMNTISTPIAEKMDLSVRFVDDFMHAQNGSREQNGKTHEKTVVCCFLFSAEDFTSEPLISNEATNGMA